MPISLIEEWEDEPCCPVCGEIIEDLYFIDGKNEYECDCGTVLLILKLTRFSYKVISCA